MLLFDNNGPVKKDKKDSTGSRWILKVSKNFPKIYGLVEKDEIDRQLAEQAHKRQKMTKFCENREFAKQRKNINSMSQRVSHLKS